MAATWIATAQAVAYASAKSMIDFFQDSSGTRVHRVYRLNHFNNQQSAVAGILTTMQILRITAASSGTSITLVARDTTSSALNVHSTAGTGRTVTTSDLFRQYLWSNDEPSVSTASMDEWECFVPFSEVWNAGYSDSNVQPITCRTTQGVTIKQSSASAVGVADFDIECTDEAS